MVRQGSPSPFTTKQGCPEVLLLQLYQHFRIHNQDYVQPWPQTRLWPRLPRAYSVSVLSTPRLGCSQGLAGSAEVAPLLLRPLTGRRTLPKVLVWLPEAVSADVHQQRPLLHPPSRRLAARGGRRIWRAGQGGGVSGCLGVSDYLH